MNGTRARWWFGATALVVGGFLIQVFVTANAAEGFSRRRPDGCSNVFCFFTVQSSVIVGITCLLLASDPGRSSTAFKTFRLTGVGRDHRLAHVRSARLSVLFPVCWLVFTLVRGSILDFYQYPFVDVINLGYARVLVNCVWVAVLYPSSSRAANGGHLRST